MCKMFLALVMALAVEAAPRPARFCIPTRISTPSAQRPRTVISRAAWISQSLPVPMPPAATQDRRQPGPLEALPSARHLAPWEARWGAQRAPERRSERPLARPPDSCTGYSASRNAVLPLRTSSTDVFRSAGISLWAGTKRSSPVRWLLRSCACEESRADGGRFVLSIYTRNGGVAGPGHAAGS
jgi:hypothetical protein